MIPRKTFLRNLELVRRFKHIQGDVVECGVWKGGMIAGIAEVFGPSRDYHLFDSFEGLPKVRDVDGKDALCWQNDNKKDTLLNNCKAEISFAQEAMSKSKVKNVYYHEGWFSDTLSKYNSNNGIAILRLDGDWYDSTYLALDSMYKHVNPGGIIIIDDYLMWEGCSKAVHDFLSKQQLPIRIYQYNNLISYMIKI